MLILIFEKTAHIPNLNVVILLNHLIDQLDTKSTRVKWQLYNCFYHILNVRKKTEKVVWMTYTVIIESKYKAK
jgi:hypothetical protein